MYFPRGNTSSFPGAMTLAEDGGALRRNRQPHPGDIDGKEGAFVLSGEHTAGFDGLSRPAIEAKDAVSLRDGVPALEINELAPIMSVPCTDMPVIGLTFERSHLSY